MPTEKNKRFAFFQVGDTRLPISAIQELPESNDSQNENDNIIKSEHSLSFSFSLNDNDVQNFVVNCLRIKRKYLKGKYTKRSWHLIKYGKTKRVRHKNWKRGFGRKNTVTEKKRR